MPLNLLHYGCAAAVGAAAGFVKPLYFISAGYGAAIFLQSGLASAFGRAAATDPLGRLHLAAVAGYGLRLASFVLWRDSLSSFQRRKAESDAKLSGMPLSKKLGMWVGVVPLYTALFLPALLNSAAGAGASAPALMNNVSKFVGAPLMLAALVWEAVADYQQQMHCQRRATSTGPKLPCTSGLWSLSRQANYFGECAFWTANYLTALRAYTSVPQALCAAVGAVAIVGIIASESRRREADKERRYGEMPQWQQYKRDTAQIVPWVHCIGSAAGGSSRSLK